MIAGWLFRLLRLLVTKGYSLERPKELEAAIVSFASRPRRGRQTGGNSWFVLVSSAPRCLVSNVGA